MTPYPNRNSGIENLNNTLNFPGYITCNYITILPLENFQFPIPNSAVDYCNFLSFSTVSAISLFVENL